MQLYGIFLSVAVQLFLGQRKNFAFYTLASSGGDQITFDLMLSLRGVLLYNFILLAIPSQIVIRYICFQIKWDPFKYDALFSLIEFSLEQEVVTYLILLEKCGESFLLCLTLSQVLSLEIQYLVFVIRWCPLKCEYTWENGLFSMSIINLFVNLLLPTVSVNRDIK